MQATLASLLETVPRWKNLKHLRCGLNWVREKGRLLPGKYEGGNGNDYQSILCYNLQKHSQTMVRGHFE
jgi:hypothetical protein